MFQEAAEVLDAAAEEEETTAADSEPEDTVPAQNAEQKFLISKAYRVHR
jgi:hypothetical protein